MRGRQKSKEPVVLTKKQFFIRWGVIDTVYCAFAWLVLAAVSMQTMQLYGNSSDSDLAKFTLTFFGCIAGLIGLILYAWRTGRKSYADWNFRYILLLLGIGAVSIGTGLVVMYIAAKLFSW